MTSLTDLSLHIFDKHHLVGPDLLVFHQNRDGLLFGSSLILLTQLYCVKTLVRDYKASGVQQILFSP